jgi:uncharacterized membrane protein HdeD (DUF308 family)
LSIPASRTLRWLTAALLLVAASLAVSLPFVSATFLTIALGGAAIVAGVCQLLRLTAPDDRRSRIFRGLSGALYLAGGISLVAFPVASTVSLTLYLGFLIAFEGVMELAAAAANPIPARGLVLLDGILTVVVGGLLIAGWPGDSVWAIGTLFGIGLAFSGFNLLFAPPPAADGSGAAA